MHCRLPNNAFTEQVTDFLRIESGSLFEDLHTRMIVNAEGFLSALIGYLDAK